MTIKDLEPKALWSNFYSLTRCPRPSKHEEAVRDFLVKWAKSKKIDCRVDKVGNVIMTKPATKGMEKRCPVVLQAHMDMVPHFQFIFQVMSRRPCEIQDVCNY